MDQNKHPKERDKFRDVFQKSFPNPGEEYEVLKTSTALYNCIAHTVEISDDWIQPETGAGNDPFSLMDEFYEEHGFARTPGMTFDSDPVVQKVVLYALKTADGSIEKVTHAAIQDPSGNWESKVGQGPLIRHRTPDAIIGPLYGEPIAVYIKKW